VAAQLRKSGFDVTEGIGGTGVVGILRNGDGPAVLLRSELDALPVKEDTGLPYSSTVTTTNPAGATVPVSHVCGHDMHLTCLLGASDLMSRHKDQWQGTFIALFQPAEEVGGGAAEMVNDHLAQVVGKVDVCLAQHVLALPSGTLGTRNGPIFSAEDALTITLHGRGGHGSMPQATVDPVVMAAMAVVRLQTIVSREVAPTEAAVVTVGSVRAGTEGNVIPEQAVMDVNVRSYTDATRTAVLDAIRRIVTAESEASAAPKAPDFDTTGQFPTTVNSSSTTPTVAAAFSAYFGDDAVDLPLQTASEDFSYIPKGLDAPFTYWAFGGTDPATYAAAVKAGTVHEIPVNHSPKFAPVIQPTMDIGTSALVVAALAWLAP
jgi:hippurate hydrolase